jgi:methanogenic corrinoid protein MtbC1
MPEWRHPQNAHSVSADWEMSGTGDVCRVHAPHSDADRARLERTIEEQIIPRLMMMHRTAVEAPTAALAPANGLRSDNVAELARLVIGRNSDDAFGYVQGLRERGVPLEQIYLDLLVPTARLLGEMWNADYCDFTDVTIGLWRLQQLLHNLSPAFLNEAQPRSADRRLLLVPEPGEQHTFGLIMVSEFFRRAGWDVWDEPLSSRDALLDLVRREAFSVVGLSVGYDARLDSLTETIRLVRKHSRNRDVKVMVGGALFVARPDRVALVGADSTACDGREAIREAENLVDATPASRS